MAAAILTTSVRLYLLPLPTERVREELLLLLAQAKRARRMGARWLWRVLVRACLAEIARRNER